jgi:hypothetical protein
VQPLQAVYAKAPATGPGLFNVSGVFSALPAAGTDTCNSKKQDSIQNSKHSRRNFYKWNNARINCYPYQG